MILRKVLDLKAGNFPIVAWHILFGFISKLCYTILLLRKHFMIAHLLFIWPIISTSYLHVHNVHKRTITPANCQIAILLHQQLVHPVIILSVKNSHNQLLMRWRTYGYCCYKINVTYYVKRYRLLDITEYKLHNQEHVIFFGESIRCHFEKCIVLF